MTDRELVAKSFDEVADLYDQARPTYQEEIFDDLFALGGLGPGSSVLEIGCGPGKASLPLARRGYRLTCLEPGAHLAEIARRNLAIFPHAQVIGGSFETWESHGILFDAVFAASSWHWLDPETCYAKTARVLKADGILAIVTMVHAFPEGFDPIFTEIQQCYESVGKGLPKWPPPRPEEVPDLREQIESTGFFRDVRVKRYLWTVDYTGEQYVDMIRTHSDHLVMDASQRDRVLSDVKRLIGARVAKKHYLAILHVARSVSQSTKGPPISA